MRTSLLELSKWHSAKSSSIQALQVNGNVPRRTTLYVVDVTLNLSHNLWTNLLNCWPFLIISTHSNSPFHSSFPSIFEKLDIKSWIYLNRIQNRKETESCSTSAAAAVALGILLICTKTPPITILGIKCHSESLVPFCITLKWILITNGSRCGASSSESSESSKYSSLTFSIAAHCTFLLGIQCNAMQVNKSIDGSTLLALRGSYSANLERHFLDNDFMPFLLRPFTSLWRAITGN